MGVALRPLENHGAHAAEQKVLAIKVACIDLLFMLKSLGRWLCFYWVVIQRRDLTRFVGSDVQGYGRGFLLCRGTTWRKGSQSNEQFRKFGAGSKLEFIVDTDKGYGTVQICDAESGENYGVIMTKIFKGIERGVCYPAVSPYEVGDKITVISCRHIKSRRTKYRLYTPRLAVQKNISNDNLENAAEKNLIQLMSTMTDRLLESSFEDESVILILHYLFHPLIAYYSTNAIFPLPEGNKVLQKIFLVLEKLIRNVKDIDTLDKASPRNDVIFDNILSSYLPRLPNICLHTHHRIKLLCLIWQSCLMNH